MSSLSSISNENGKSSIEALQSYEMILKSFKKSKLSPIYGIIRDKKKIFRVRFIYRHLYINNFPRLVLQISTLVSIIS